MNSGDEDDDAYMPPNRVDAARSQVIAGWSLIWSQAFPQIDGLLTEYDYGETFAGLLANPANTLNVLILPPEDDEEFRLDVYLEVAFPDGSQMFSAEFNELEFVDAVATF